MSYLIKSSAIEDFENIFIESIEDSIRRMVNNRFLLKEYQSELSFSFYENYLVIIQIKNGTVTKLTRCSYAHFIPDKFLNNLSAVQNLPPRLRRYRSLGFKRFRNEIKESLITGKIIVENNNVLWPDYNFNLKFSSKKVSLESVLN